MDILIRKANSEDLKCVQELNYKLFELEYNNFNSALNRKWTFSEKGESYFKELIEDGTIWVAEDNNKVIGYLAGSIKRKPAYVTKTLAELDNFYIDEEYRRRGIGKKLVEEFKKYCILQGIEEIEVTTNCKNINAREFYKNNNFDDFEITYKMNL
jgi:ribosomal protein S18 acetylase RimI-like enzyme